MSDPILDKRARLARWTSLGQRFGYALFAMAVVTFFIGMAAGFGDVIVWLITAALVVGSIVLAPSIVLGYAVKAADRADREDDWR